MKKTNKKAKKPELIHVKLEYDELIQVKKDLLSLQLQLLKILKSISKYHYLRKIELDKKILFYNYLKNTNKYIVELQNQLPMIKIPKILQKNRDESNEFDFQKKNTNEPTQINSDLEMQLQDIQNRLKSLQA